LRSGDREPGRLPAATRRSAQDHCGFWQYILGFAREARLTAIGVEPERPEGAPVRTTKASSEVAAPHAATTPEAAAKAHTPREGTKRATLIAMLRAETGATIEEMMAATGCQSHTVRGAMGRCTKEEAGAGGDLWEDRGPGAGLSAAGGLIRSGLQSLISRWPSHLGAAVSHCRFRAA
jgi:hypothetical protein